MKTPSNSLEALPNDYEWEPTSQPEMPGSPDVDSTQERYVEPDLRPSVPTTPTKKPPPLPAELPNNLWKKPSEKEPPPEPDLPN